MTTLIIAALAFTGLFTLFHRAVTWIFTVYDRGRDRLRP